MSKEQHPIIFGGPLEWHTDPNDKPKIGKRIVYAIAFDNLSIYILNSILVTFYTDDTPFGLHSIYSVFAWAYINEDALDGILADYRAKHEAEYKKARIAALKTELECLEAEKNKNY